MFEKPWRLFAPEGAPASGGGESADATLPEDRGDNHEDDDDDDAAATDPKKVGAKDSAGDTAGDADDAGDDDDDDKPAAGKSAADKRIKIPKARLDQEITKRRAAEERATAAEQRLNARAAAADVGKLEGELAELDDKYDTAISDGDKDEAKKIKVQMRLIERQITRAETSAEAGRAQFQAVDSLKYDMLLERIEEQHPQLNQDSDDFNQEVANEVIELMGALQTKGLSRTDALKRAVKYVVGAPNVKAKAEPDVGGLRSADAKKKAADAIAKTPGDNRKVGRSTPDSQLAARAVAAMSQKEFAKMSDEDLSKLRGDTL